MKTYLQKVGWKRVLFMILGVVLISVGVAIMRFAGFGTEPFSCMNIGISSHLPISYGTYQIIVNVVLFIPVIILYPRSFGIGAFFNMIGVGYIVDFCVWFCGLFGVTVEGLEPFMAVRFLLLFVALLVFCFGVALYLQCDLGAAPYDMIAQIAEDRSHGKLKFKWVRVCQDLFCMLLGIISGGTFGFATIIVSFCTGPAVSWLRKNVVKRLL